MVGLSISAGLSRSIGKPPEGYRQDGIISVESYTLLRMNVTRREFIDCAEQKAIISGN